MHSAKWDAHINFKKEHYHLKQFSKKSDAIRARKTAEAKLHDPFIFENLLLLTDEQRKEFLVYTKTKENIY